MTSISLTGVGAVLVTVLNALFPLIGIELPEGSVESGVIGVMNFVGFVLLIYGQARRKDVTGFVGKV
jgi:hypothetical protein